MKRIKVIGLGGIGSYLAEPLSRYLSHSQEEVEITLVDGDSYEDKNRNRQQFSGLENKARHTSLELATKFPNVSFKYKSEYLSDDNVYSVIRENDTVFACVDNHATRKLISDRCEELDNVTLISGGNEYTDGDVILYRRVQGKDLGKPLTQHDPFIAEPQDQNPAYAEKQDGCVEQTEDNPQLLFTNNTIAVIMCNTFYGVEKDCANYERVYVDILTQKSRPTPENNFFEFEE